LPVEARQNWVEFDYKEKVEAEFKSENQNYSIRGEKVRGGTGGGGEGGRGKRTPKEPKYGSAAAHKREGIAIEGGELGGGKMGK